MKTQAKTIMILLIMSFPMTLLAQLPPDPYDNVDDVPFDNQVAVLVTIAIGYGLIKIFAHRKKGKVIIAESKTFI